MDGIVTNIQRFSVNDGTGIRTVVFLKGCPLHCQWCCNPENIELRPQLIFHKRKCIECGLCHGGLGDGIGMVEYVSQNGCLPTGLDEEICPTGALERVGRRMSSNEVLSVVERDRQFYGDDGGLTLSGGEALVQWKFAFELVKMAHERDIRVAIETTGFVTWESLELVTRYCDEVLFDIKHLDSKRHREGTRRGNEKILDNFRRLTRTRSDKVKIRVPLIEGFNADSTNIARLADLGKETGVKEIHLLPYHELGEPKYEKLGLTYDFLGETPTDERVEEIREYLEGNGFKVLVGG